MPRAHGRQIALNCDPLFAPNNGSDAMRLNGADQAGLQQVYLRPSIHLALHQLEFCDLALGLTVPSRECVGIRVSAFSGI